MPRSTADMILFEAALRIGIREENQQPICSASGPPRRAIPTIRWRCASSPMPNCCTATARRRTGCSIACSPRARTRRSCSTSRGCAIWSRRRATIRRKAQPPRRGNGSTRAHRVDPNHFQTLYRFAQSLRGEADISSENTSNVLLLAHQLAPQVATVDDERGGHADEPAATLPGPRRCCSRWP